MAGKPKLPRGIRLRGSSYLVDVSHKGQRRTATAASLAEALVERDRIKGDLVTGRDPTTTARANARMWTIKEALEKTLQLPKPDGWRGTAYESIATLNVKDAMQHFGPNAILAELTRDQIDAWVHSLEAKGNSDSTINRKISALSKVAKVAGKYGGLKEALPLPSLRKEKKGRIRQLSPEEEAKLDALFRAKGQYEIADAVTVLIDTGLRLSELWAVHWEDVMFPATGGGSHGVLLVYGEEGRGTKGGDYRSVPMTSRVCAIFERRKGLIPTLNKPFDLTNSDMRHKWDAARDQMGLTNDPNFVPHVCRHTCASRLVRRGISLPVVKDWLGHKDIKTTMKYAHLMPQDLMAAVKVLED